MHKKFEGERTLMRIHIGESPQMARETVIRGDRSTSPHIRGQDVRYWVDLDLLANPF